MTNKKDELDYDQLMLISQGHVAFQVLWAGVQLGVFNMLSKQPGLSREQITIKLGITEQPARILLVGLTAVGLLVKEDDSYRNAEVVERYMISGKPDSLAPTLGWQHHIVYPGLVDFVESLQKGTNVGLRHFPGEGNTLYQRLVSHPEIEQVFQDAMSALSKQANKDLIQVMDLSGVSHLMDVGGGDATNAIAFAKRFPHLKATVFDSPSVCNIAKEHIAAHKLQDRVGTYPGELFSTPFPQGMDAIIYCHMFTIWSPEENIQIIRKTFDALPEGGMLIIFNMMGNEDDTGPVSTALGSPYFLTIATAKGMLYSWLDYEQWMNTVGFSEVRKIEGLPLDHGVFVGIK